MNKKPQMRWNRAAVQPFLDVRTAVLKDMLNDAFRGGDCGVLLTNDDDTATATAV